MNIKDLKQNPDNPRTVTEKKLAMLKKAIEEFGDLSGVIFNIKTGQLVGGHQRVKVLNSDCGINIDRRFKKPTRTGTVAVGYILAKGERFPYREVSWPLEKEKLANLAANKSAGDWDRNKLSEFLSDLGSFKLDLNLSMFDDTERLKFKTALDQPKNKKDDGRVSSSEVQTVHLTFTKSTSEEFTSLVEHFQKLLNIDNTTDCILEVLRLAKDNS